MANELVVKNGLKVGLTGVAISTILDEDTLVSDSATALATQQSIKAYVDSVIGGLASALEYKGGFDASGGSFPVTPSVGDMYIVTTAGTVGSDVLEVGDMILCSVASPVAWDVVQGNIENAVESSVSAGSSLEGELVSFDGTSGKIIKKTGVIISTDDTLAGDADTNVPTEQAVKGYVDTALGAKQDTLTFGIANTNAVKIDSADVANGEYSKFTATGIEGKTFTEVKTDLALENVTNNAQVKKLATSIDEEVVIWDGITGDTVKASGITVTSLTDGLVTKVTGTSEADIDLVGVAIEGTAYLKDASLNGSIVVKFLCNNNGSGAFSYNAYETTSAGNISDLVGYSFAADGNTGATLSVTSTSNVWNITIKYSTIL